MSPSRSFLALICLAAFAAPNMPLPLPDLNGPPGRLGLSVTRPGLLPSMSHV